MKRMRGCAAERYQPFGRANLPGQRRDVAEEFLDNLLRDCGRFRHAISPHWENGTSPLPNSQECYSEHRASARAKMSGTQDFSALYRKF